MYANIQLTKRFCFGEKFVTVANTAKQIFSQYLYILKHVKI